LKSDRSRRRIASFSQAFDRSRPINPVKSNQAIAQAKHNPSVGR
jgi:hypothetical protein